ncbi:3-isopropylmalate dehydratase large subunit [Marispirochaeta aestuarii]|uniref:3-isopropylmalate dehydratase large subunit n=1 Tax=Marispirochaeta aestuarii TaxID=1963862 RepID=A0A1Y1S1Q2_9SPIO|nr:3-isopropylmalate dehydratase large subunit [Marispirochaeta aestuarii]ORC36558.1 3-isopropylmalate dehydratase large subunit [Marispirochaeta aestuarii]
MAKTLLDKVWEHHLVRTLPSGQDQLLIGLHLIHEVTSPQAFDMLRTMGLGVKFPGRTFATVDHIVPTRDQQRPFQDELAEKMMAELEKNTDEFGITFFNLKSGRQGIVHIVGPEMGLTQPGMTIACGDSHTSTHGAFGSIAFGIGTSQIRDILASGTMAISKPKIRRIRIDGKLGPGVYAKDIILRIIRDLGVKGGLGYAYEYAGEAIEALSMEERMTICNMSIEGGARFGYVNPDATTFDYIKGRPYAPKDFSEAVQRWQSYASDADATYDDEYLIDGGSIAPMVTWGINPGQALEVDRPLPDPDGMSRDEREVAARAYEHMGFRPGNAIKGTPIDVAFLGSCTNGRISDLREAAAIVKGRRIASKVRGMVVPGSMSIARQAEAEGLDRIFTQAGFEWRGAGCSMCLAMNPDKLRGPEISASSSNRNFIGRQGSPSGRTLLMSPAMVAAAALAGQVVDIRESL